MRTDSNDDNVDHVPLQPLRGTPHILIVTPQHFCHSDQTNLGNVIFYISRYVVDLIIDGRRIGR